MASKYHLRSISLPSRSHPTTLQIEDELNRLKTWEASQFSASQSVSDGLSGLEDLYQCMNDLLNMASTQQVLSQHQHERCIDELLDASVRLLDICGIARDYMFQIKEHVHALQSALRRWKGDSSIESNIHNYTCFRKEMKKQSRKLITELKQMDNKLGAWPLIQNQDDDFSAVIRVLREVNVMNISIFQSFFTFFSAPVCSKQTRWFLVSKLMHKGGVSSEEKQENVNELENVDAALCNTCDVEKMKIAHKRLVALEGSVQGLENRLECVFRHLINARTSLLNIISQ